MINLQFNSITMKDMKFRFFYRGVGFFLICIATIITAICAYQGENCIDQLDLLSGQWPAVIHSFFDYLEEINSLLLAIICSLISGITLFYSFVNLKKLFRC